MTKEQFIEKWIVMFKGTEGYENRYALMKNDLDELNQALSQHDVIKSVCPKCKSSNMSDGTGKIGTCFECYHVWQTDL